MTEAGRAGPDAAFAVIDACPECRCEHRGSATFDGAVYVTRYLSPDCGCVCHGRRDRAAWSRVRLPSRPQPRRSPTDLSVLRRI